MKLVSWNVNGLRAVYKKGFMDIFNEIDADIFAVQETKMQEGQLVLELDGYTQIWNSAERKGYSGTAIFTKHKPISVSLGLGIAEHDTEGRVITIELNDFYFITIYTPNSKSKLERLEYRQVWEDEFRKYVNALKKTKPVIICGDLNVAHKEIDLKNPDTNRRSAGFTDEEREKFQELLDSGFTDTFRYLYPDKEDAYTWWSPITRARDRNVGWRIDYFVVSDDLNDRIKEASILDDIFGSDHCPVMLELK